MPVLEVRCCCDAGKLLGFLAVEEWQVRLGTRLTYFVSDTPAPDPKDFVPDAVPNRPSRSYRLDLEVAELHPSALDAPYLAVRDNGVPIEQLRLLKDFREIP
jgi:hypothetical protein